MEITMPVTILPREQLAEQAGRKFEPGSWITLDQERINAFADCTGDHQFIHVDEEKAAETPFGGTIAHGMLTLSMLAEMSQEDGIAPDDMAMGLNYGFDKVRFLAPVRAGKRIRPHIEVISVDQKDDKRFLIKQKVTVEIEGEDIPALVAEFLLMTISN
jgi:acyl dehydratase